jgi:hypothetical protein
VAGERTERVYEVEEDHMRVVRLIFEMVGVEGVGNRTVARRLNERGFPTPPAPVKEKHPEKVWGWRHQFVRKCVLNDAYRPHTPEEVGRLAEEGFMAPEVAARAPADCGIWWYTGKDFEGNEHRVAVPVPPSGVSREVEDAARAAIVDIVPIPSAGSREFWELLGGILYCGGCGLRMQAHAVKSHGRVYFYLRCPLHLRVTPERCPVNARLPAEKAEEAVWNFVMRLLVEPERMVAGVEDVIDHERSRLRTDPEQEIRGLRSRLRDLDRRRERAQEAYLVGAFSVDELRARQEQLEGAKQAILDEIDANENRGERLRHLIELRDKVRYRAERWYALLEEYSDLGSPPPWEDDAFASVWRDAFGKATPEQRHARYRELELRVEAHSKDELEISGVFGKEMLYICHPSPKPRRTAITSSASTLTGWSYAAGGRDNTSKPLASKTSRASASRAG